MTATKPTTPAAAGSPDLTRLDVRHDPVTGLLNRLGLVEIHARHGGGRAVVTVGLRGLTPVAEAFGHPVVDDLVRVAATRFARGLEDGDILARVDDRVFAILTTPERAEQVAVRCQRHLVEPVRLDGITIVPRAAIGVVLEAHEDVEELLRRSAVARSGARLNPPEISRYRKEDDLARDRLRLASDLRRSIAAGDLELHYQALFGMQSRQLKGLEALVRWRRGGRLVPPAAFVPLAESTGLIAPLAEWVINEACRQWMAWDRDGLAPPIMGINISPYELPLHDVTAVIGAALAHHGMAPERLCVEFTESALHLGSGAVEVILADLSAMGVRCALDDFGADFSSLRRLAELPFEMIKVDRGFLDRVPADPRASALLGAIVALGRSLGVMVTVEGVESETQLAYLAELGVDLVQGFRLGRPAPAAAIATLLQTATPDGEWPSSAA